MAKKPGAGGFILAAMILGLIAVYGVYRYESNLKKQARENWVPIVVARDDIPARTKVTDDMVTLISYPKDLLTPEAVQDRKDVEGRITLVRLKAKEQIRSSDLLPPGQTPSISYDIPAGMRAISIGASEVGAAGGAVKPGDHVDILATYSEPTTHQETTRLVLQNVLVLFVNQAETNPQGNTGAKSSMTLAVNPEDAELLTAADRGGVLRVMLRAPTDKKIVPTPGVTVRDFGGQKSIEMAPQSPNATATPVIIMPSSRPRSEMTIVRGTQEQVVPTQ
ncbi:MAG TPA: Flp pilus assembly protein CpaB [Verrucomicrobiae bacterium]|nr:Flp pilus assembly protein CpaB [Verrucomicrobiae bacterium]